MNYQRLKVLSRCTFDTSRWLVFEIGTKVSARGHTLREFFFGRVRSLNQTKFGIKFLLLNLKLEPCLIKRTTLTGKFSCIHVLILRVNSWLLLILDWGGDFELSQFFIETFFAHCVNLLYERGWLQSQRCCFFRQCIQIRATPEKVIVLGMELLFVNRLKTDPLIVFGFLKHS